MELTDSTLEYDLEIELQMPDAELFDHLGIDQQDRYPSDEARKKFAGIDVSDWDYTPDEGEPRRTPPAPHEHDKCDHCGASDKGAIGQYVDPRPTSLLTAPARAEYLCPECYAQVVSQYIGLDPYPALVAILLQKHAPVWKISEFHDRDVDDVEDVAIDVLAEWKVAYDTDKNLREDEREFITERQERFVELFPSLGVGQPGIEFDGSISDPDVSLTDVV